MTVNSYVSNGKTYIYAEYPSKGRLYKQRIRLYLPNGATFDTTGGYGDTVSVTLAIEDYPDIFITPYPNSVKGRVGVGFEDFVELFGFWYEEDKKDLYYTILPTDYTRPSMSMTLSMSIPELGYYLKGVSAVKATFSSNTKYGASIASYKLRVESQDYTSYPPTNVITSNKLNTSGELIVTGTVTDSRGFSSEITQTITVTGLKSTPSLDTVSCSTTMLDGVVTCKYTPANSVFYSKIYTYAKVGETLNKIRDDELGTALEQRSVSFSFTSGQLAKIYEKFPSTRTTTLRFKLVTYTTSAYSESDRLPEEYYIDINLDIPNTTETSPTITSIAVTPSPLLYQDPNLYVKQKNGAKVTIVARGKFGASVKAKWEILGQEYSSGESAELLSLAGKIAITITATDSRGFSVSEKREINVLDVTEPQIIVSANTYLTEAISSSITRGNSQFCSMIVVYHGETQLEAEQIGTQTSKTITLSKLSRETVYEKNPSSTQVKLTVKLFSFTDNSYKYQYGEPIEKEITLKIPNDETTRPADIQIVCAPSDYPIGFEGIFVNKKSKVQISVQAKGQYQAQIVSYAINLDGKNYTVTGSSGVITTGFLTTSAEKVPATVTVKVTDSRGFENTATSQIKVYDYYSPHVGVADGEIKVIAQRADSNGNPLDNGSFLAIAAKKRYASVNNKNKCALRYRIKAGPNENFGDYITLSGYDSADEYRGNLNLGLDAQSVYYVELSVIDRAGEIDSMIIIIPTEIVYMDRSGTRGSIAFGGHVTQDKAFEVYRDAFFYGNVKVAADEYAWKSLGLDTNVTNSKLNIGRKESGCFIRKDIMSKVQIVFNCSFEGGKLPLRINKDDIEVGSLPQNDTISICVAGSGNKQYLAGIAVTADGQVQIVWIMDISTGSNVASVAWIDGYIEYFV